ncbi:MAG TPA: hypothetical protein PK683_19675, partial [Leptospiraceae bacterium]|nr:hypothetical protein [Leptospiraceae bacterium]
MIQFPGLDTMESLHSGRHSLVFRVQRRGESFILKYLNYDYPSTDIYRNFVREFETLCQVRMPGVVEAVSLEKYRNSLYILFRDRGGRALS